MHRAIAVLIGIILLLDVGVVAGGGSNLTAVSIGPGNRAAGIYEGSSPAPTSSPTVTPSPHPTPSPEASPTADPSDALATGPSSTPPAAPAPRPKPSPGPSVELSITMNLENTGFWPGEPLWYFVRIDHVWPNDEVPLVLDFGNGAVHGPADFTCGPAASDGGGSSERMATECDLQHSYRRTGPYTITATVCGGCPASEPHGTASWDIVVGEGPYMGNGEAEPTIESYPRRGPNDRTVEWRIRSEDVDGCLESITIDFGDGSDVLVLDYTARCKEPGPEAFPWSSWTPDPFHHTFPDDGDYWVTTTVTSTAADGSEAQTTTMELLVEIPLPQGIPGGG